MHLMYLPGPDGHRIYTLKKSLDGRATISAHPARFSPDDKFSRERLIAKSRFRDRMANGWLDATLMRGEKTGAAAKEEAKGDVNMDEPESD